MKEERDFYKRLSEKGVSRRDFMKYCGALTATMGLSSSFIPKVAEVFAAPTQRPPVIWLHFAECTGCSEALLRSMYPWIDELLLEGLSTEYHETIMAAAGQQAEDNLQAAVKKYQGKFICVVEGAIATKYNGGYGKIGRTRRSWKSQRKYVPKAAAVICIGTCASFGGVQAAAPNPGGYKGVGEAMGIKTDQHPRMPAQPHQFRRYHRQLSPPGQTSGSWTTRGGPFLPTARRFMTSVQGGPTIENDEFVEEFGSEEAADGLLPLQDGLQGSGNLQQLPHSQIQRRNQLAHRRPVIPASDAVSRTSGTR